MIISIYKIFLLKEDYIFRNIHVHTIYCSTLAVSSCDTLKYVYDSHMYMTLLYVSSPRLPHETIVIIA